MPPRGSLQVYRAYGLNLHSELPLPGLPPGDPGRVDIEICLGTITHLREPESVDEDRSFWAVSDRACHTLRGVGSFLVQAGREIVIQPEPDAPKELLRLSLLGPVLALALQQRGLFVLHASGVAVADSAVAFMGGFARGKSTIAAGLNRLGHAIVSDDVTAVDTAGEVPTAVLSFPQLKLWPDALHRLRVASETLPRVHPSHDKRVLRLDQDFADSALPLRRLYVLTVGDSIAIQGLSALASFEQIMRHWYGARFGTGLLEEIDLREQFLHAGTLTRSVPVKRLTRPAAAPDDRELPRAIESAILRDLEGELGESSTGQTSRSSA